ncbi:hypothetical protein [Streptomyces sp. NPDC059169]|uniref:hypothetical protein n=1 Tax=unclassified Streptomyces TaxID=2593676 RepID=UPI0036B1BDA2
MARFPKGYVKPTDSCDSCLAWGNSSGRLCPTCYMFGRGHDAAVCTGCRRDQPLKWNYCRLCWCQARLSAKAVVGRPRDETDVRDRLAAIRHHQLFFVGMDYRRRPTPAARTRGGRRGATRKPPPAPAWRPDPGWRQLPLFAQIPRDYSQLALADADLSSPWLAWAKYLAHRLAETRGWGRNIRFAVNRGLALVLTGHVEGDVIRHTEIFAPLRALDLPVGHTVTVLDEMGIFEDDSEPSFERWLAERLEGLAPGIHSEAERWTPRPARRRPPQPPATGRHGLALPQPGPPGPAGMVEPLRPPAGGDPRRRPHLHQDTARPPAPRPTRRPALAVHLGQAERADLPQPHQSDQGRAIRVRRAASAHPRAGRSLRRGGHHPGDAAHLSLAAVHAAWVAQIANLMLDDLDIGNRRLTIAGRVRPLDDLTLKLLLDWLEHRRNRWPNTANLHLLINNQTATRTSRASNHWISASMRGQDATLERLRVDRQLEEALTHGPDPLHLAEVFGLDEKTAMRYADSARALLHQAAEQPLQ